MAKGGLDVIGPAFIVVVLLPMLCLISVLVCLDRGPVFYGHSRIGAGGKRLKCLKSRSMVVDGDEALRQLLDSDPDAAQEWALTHKLRQDPRVTKVGRFLRSTSLDELPQLFNGLKLEMSLVGPRPVVEAELTRYGHYISYYYRTRPGMTGLWQISGRSTTSYSRRVALDTSYVRNWSLGRDLYIIALTIPAVLKREGAH